MPKKRVIRKTLQIDVLGDGLSGLKELSKDEQEGAGFFDDGRGGFTIGSPRLPNELDGEMQDWRSDRSLLDEWKVNLEIRLTCDPQGKAYLEVQRPGSGRFHRFEFSGISFEDLVSVTGRFNNAFGDSVIYDSLYPLFFALYYSKISNKEEREGHFKQVLDKFKEQFSSIFKPKEYKVINEEQKRGLTVILEQRKEVGRRKGTKKRRELSENEKQRKKDRALLIVEAVRVTPKIDNKTALARHIGISRGTLSRWLLELGVDSPAKFDSFIRKALRN
ncbi:MAG: hypothetical protein QM785_05545 [Pyrinomonadaceae bacterium]